MIVLQNNLNTTAVTKCKSFRRIHETNENNQGKKSFDKIFKNSDGKKGRHINGYLCIPYQRENRTQIEDLKKNKTLVQQIQCKI